MKIPVAVKRNGRELFIAFWATRTVLNASTLRIRFRRENRVEGLVYVLAMKDLLPQKRQERTENDYEAGKAQ